jgi:inhibitor of cysteine peptidase
LKKILITLLAGVLLATGLAGCSSQTQTSTASTPISSSSATSTSAPSITASTGSPGTIYTDSNKSIDISVNQEFTIALKSNPSTGYSWEPQFDSSAVQKIKDEYKAPESTGQPVVGAGGTAYFTFKAVKSGQTQIKFVYYRPWETPSDTDKTEIFTINAK